MGDCNRTFKSVSICGNCKRCPQADSSPLLWCGRCKSISYCNKECQTIDWPNHKAVCNFLLHQHGTADDGTESETDYLICLEEMLSRKECQATDFLYTELVCVSRKGYEKCVSLFLRNGVSPNDVSSHSITPLHQACRNGRYKCAMLLLQAGALVNKKHRMGSTPLFDSCIVGQLKCVVLLVEHKADVNVHCGNKYTPLMACAMNGKVNVMSYLIAHEADVHATDINEQTAVQHAYMHGHQKCVELLLQHGANESSLFGLEYGIYHHVSYIYRILL